MAFGEFFGRSILLHTSAIRRPDDRCGIVVNYVPDAQGDLRRCWQRRFRPPAHH
jgi:hypothetical protein